MCGRTACTVRRAGAGNGTHQRRPAPGPVRAGVGTGVRRTSRRRRTPGGHRHATSTAAQGARRQHRVCRSATWRTAVLSGGPACSSTSSTPVTFAGVNAQCGNTLPEVFAAAGGRPRQGRQVVISGTVLHELTHAPSGAGDISLRFEEKLTEPGWVPARLAGSPCTRPEGKRLAFSKEPRKCTDGGILIIHTAAILVAGLALRR